MASINWLLSVALLVVLQIDLQVAAKSLPLPPFVKPCPRNDPNLDKCSLEHGRESLPFVIRGNHKIGVPNLDPLLIPEVRVDQGGGGSVGISLINRDLNITGLKDIVFENVSTDLKKRHIVTWYTTPRLEIISKYEITGKILVLPIVGKGDSNITLVGNKVMHWFDYDLVDRDGEQYMVATDDNLVFNPSRVYFNLTNLFNGDKLLGDSMNMFLNENWKDVITEIGPTVTVAVRQIMRSIVEGVTKHFSYDVIYPVAV